MLPEILIPPAQRAKKVPGYKMAETDNLLVIHL